MRLLLLGLFLFLLLRLGDFHAVLGLDRRHVDLRDGLAVQLGGERDVVIGLGQEAVEPRGVLVLGLHFIVKVLFGRAAAAVRIVLSGEKIEGIGPISILRSPRRRSLAQS